MLLVICAVALTCASCVTLSVWTIDLARIMSHYGVRHLLTTITLGVDTTYSGKV